MGNGNCYWQELVENSLNLGGKTDFILFFTNPNLNKNLKVVALFHSVMLHKSLSHQCLAGVIKKLRTV